MVLIIISIFIVIISASAILYCMIRSGSEADKQMRKFFNEEE